LRLEQIYIDVPALRPGTVGAYALAVLCTGVATALRIAIDPYVEGVQYITFFPAVIVTTLISGFRAGLSCILLSAASAAFFVLPPQWIFSVDSSAQVLSLLLFILVALSDVIFITGMRFAIECHRELSRTLERRVEERGAELAKAQERLAHSQKMEALGQITGGLAHDFNNMLAIIVGSLDIMRRRIASGRTDVMRYVDSASEGAQRAALLTQRLLSFARRQPLAPAATDANKLVSGLAELLRRTLGETIHTEFVQSGGLWQAYVDPGQLESAIVNIAINARDAMPAGGTITIETANAYLDDDYAACHEEVKAGQYVVIAVTDTGAGMSAETAARAVEPFFTTKETGKGTGLGLSQVHGFVKQSGGHLAIYSEEGRGTTVRLYVPRARPANISTRANIADAGQPVAPKASRNEVVLVVEDEDHVRRMSAAALEDLGYRVRACASGDEALRILAQHPETELLFTDVVMPGMNGRQLFEAAVKQRPGLKVLYTTGYTQNAIVHDGRLDTDVSLIAKPFTVDQVARKVRAVLGG
jgi:signal transduction histidine kinase/CheY-like chemotaxis protein